MPHSKSAHVLVLASGVRFGRIEETMRMSGWTGGPVTLRPPLIPGEPEAARWHRGGSEVVYDFNPVCSFRRLTVTGELDSLRRQFVCLGLADVERLLASADDEVVMRGLLSAEALELRELLPVIRALSQRPRAVIADLAGAIAHGPILGVRGMSRPWTG